MSLSLNIHLDETYHPLMEKDTEKTPDGKLTYTTNAIEWYA